MKSQLLTLMLAAAISTGALVGGCGAADEPANKEASEPAASEKSDAAAAPAEATGSEVAPAEPAEAAAAAGGAPMTPIERVKIAEKGTLKNPYTDKPEAIAEGQKLYMGLSCNGCHGGGGGGGMCPPLTNETWVYGGDDDTLFRLITLGSQELQKQGYARKGQETVVGPMMPFGELIDDETKLWKVIAWMRTIWGGRAEKRTW